MSLLFLWLIARADLPLIRRSSDSGCLACYSSDYLDSFGDYDETICDGPLAV